MRFIGPGFFARVGVGFCVSSVVLCVLAGGVESGFMVLGLSIVCTAGVGLVFWIPLWWVVGWATLNFIGALGFPVGGQSADRKTPVLMGPHRALTSYIRKCEARGVSAEVMSAHMQSLGWGKKEIERAFQHVISSKPKAEGLP